MQVSFPRNSRSSVWFEADSLRCGRNSLCSHKELAVSRESRQADQASFWEGEADKEKAPIADHQRAFPFCSKTRNATWRIAVNAARLISRREPLPSTMEAELMEHISTPLAGVGC